MKQHEMSHKTFSQQKNEQFASNKSSTQHILSKTSTDVSQLTHKTAAQVKQPELRVH